MKEVLAFFVSVMASVVANYISKRLDRDKVDNEPEE